MHKKYSSLLLLGLVTLTTACSAHVQTSTREDWLAGYKPGNAALPHSLGAEEHDNPSQRLSLDEQVRKIGEISPLLKFPAKIGIARIQHGQLVAIPAAEMDAWAGLTEDMTEEIGTFVPLNLLVARMTPAGTTAKQSNIPHGVGRTIRLGAARQHLDAVMVYEVYGKGKSTKNALSIANLSIIGAYIIPSKRIDAVGHTSAVLLDTRNGYPYLTASKTVTKEMLSASIGSFSRKENVTEAAKNLAVRSLVEELAPAISQLKSEIEKTSQTDPDQSLVTNSR